MSANTVVPSREELLARLSDVLRRSGVDDAEDLVRLLERNLPPQITGPERRFGCERCFPESADAAWKAREGLEPIANPVDESHFSVRILGCGECAQRYVTVFTETIDWQDGEDPQYWSLLPVTEDEYRKLMEPGLDESTLDDLGPGRRSLRSDHPKGAPSRIYWATGIAVGSHD